MMVKTGMGDDFKAEIKSGSTKSQISSGSFTDEPSTSLKRLFGETSSRSTSGCINKDWQFDFVCPIFFHRFEQAYSKCSVFLILMIYNIFSGWFE